MISQTLRDQMTTGTVSVADLDIHYFDVGAGHPVVLLHGSGPGATALGNFERNIDELSKSFRVIGIDFPGWGRSTALAPGDTDQVANVFAVMDALELDRAALIGNSLGGATAVKIASQAPTRVSALIAMGVHSGLPAVLSPSGPSEGIKALIAAYRDPSPEGMLALIAAMTFDPAFRTPALAEIRSRAALERPEHLRNFLTSVQEGKYLRPPAGMDDHSRITAPTLLIHGRDDRVLPFEHSLALLPRIANSRLLLLNGCGHWAQLEHADEFNREVVAFVNAAVATSA